MKTLPTPTNITAQDLANTKWYFLYSYEGERPTKLHCFKPSTEQEYVRAYKMNIPVGDPYEGSVSLCGKFKPLGEDERIMSLSEIEEDVFNEENACKTCLKLWKR